MDFSCATRSRSATLSCSSTCSSRSWTSWIAFDSGGNHGLVYFTQMLSYRCAIKEVHYSLNGAALDKSLEIPPCDKKDPYAIPYDAKGYFKVADSVKSMSVQVTYTDGTKSPVREYKRQ